MKCNCSVPGVYECYGDKLTFSETKLLDGVLLVTVIAIIAALHKAIKQTKRNLIRWYFFHSQCLVLAGQAPVSGHLSVTALVAAYENHSRKRPAPVTDTFFASRECPLTRASDWITFTYTCELILFFVQHESCYKFVPATCRTKFNLLNFLGHVAGTKLCKDATSLRVHDCSTFSCNRINFSANHRQRLEFFALLHWETQRGGHRL